MIDLFLAAAPDAPVPDLGSASHLAQVREAPIAWLMLFRPVDACGEDRLATRVDRALANLAGGHEIVPASTRARARQHLRHVERVLRAAAADAFLVMTRPWPADRDELDTFMLTGAATDAITRSAPYRALPRAPAWQADVPALLARIEERGLGPASIRAGFARVAEELVPDLRKRINEAERLVEEHYERDEPGWLTTALSGRPRATRAAVYVRTTELVREALREADPELRRLAAGALVHTTQADAWTETALGDPDPRLRALLALGFRGDDAAVWSTLARDPDPRVRAAVLWNEHAARRPAVTDPSPLVRASHPEALEAELLELARERDDETLAALARNPRTPPAALLLVAKHFGVKPQRTGLAEVETRAVLEAISWTLSHPGYPTRAAFIAAVTAWNRAAGDPAWQWTTCDDIAIADPVIEVASLGDEPHVLRADDAARGFSEAELLWKVHEALRVSARRDRVFFQRLEELPPDTTGDTTHPVWFASIGS